MQICCSERDCRSVLDPYMELWRRGEDSVKGGSISQGISMEPQRLAITKFCILALPDYLANFDTPGLVDEKHFLPALQVVWR